MPEPDERPDDEPGAERGQRPFWSGTISFGLVTVPVNLHPAQRRQRVALRMLAPDGTPLARRYVCPEEQAEVPPEHIVRGYEVAPGKHVVVTDEELERLAPRRSRDIDLRLFVDRAALEPIYFERSYVLAPASDSTKAYRLLADAMERTNRAGIATFVMRGKEYLVAILAEGGLLRAETLRFADEIRDVQAIGLPKKGRVDRRAVSALARTIARQTKPGLAQRELEDPETAKLRALVARKRKAKQDVVEAPAGARAGDDAPADLLEVLRQSMRRQRARPKRAPRRTRRRAKTA